MAPPCARPLTLKPDIGSSCGDTQAENFVLKKVSGSIVAVLGSGRGLLQQLEESQIKISRDTGPGADPGSWFCLIFSAFQQNTMGILGLWP